LEEGDYRGRRFLFLILILFLLLLLISKLFRNPLQTFSKLFQNSDVIEFSKGA
jgi:hypothetical protein